MKHIRLRFHLWFFTFVYRYVRRRIHADLAYALFIKFYVDEYFTKFPPDPEKYEAIKNFYDVLTEKD